MTKKKIIITVIIIITIIVGAIAFFYFKNKKTVKPSGIGQETEVAQKEEKKLDPSYEYYQKMSKAIKGKDVKLCDVFIEPMRSKCVYNIANAANDSEYCWEARDEGIKEECEELFVYKKTVAGDDINRCLNLTVENFKAQCLNEFFWQWDDSGKCSVLTADVKQECEDVINKKIAFQKGDEEICDKIGNENLKLDCLVAITGKKEREKDSDNDGLMDSQERSYGADPFKIDTDNDGLGDGEEVDKYHTDPVSPDTDGDGYKDGEEVKKGYNPKGEGLL